jgi:hypothetical protein
MAFLADVIFPAFYFPYVVAVAYPLSGLSALAAEVFIFRKFYPSAKLSWLIAIVLGANVASSLLGIGDRVRASIGSKSGVRTRSGRTGARATLEPAGSH